MNQVAEIDPLLSTDFIKEMVKQMRAIDSYGTYDACQAWAVANAKLTAAQKETQE